MLTHQADSFVDYIGVNIHAGFGRKGSAATDPSNSYRRLDWLSLLKWLGIRHIRDTGGGYSGDAFVQSVYADGALADLGISTTRFVGNVTALNNMIANYHQPIAVEGGNESDLGTNPAWASDAVAFQPTLYADVKSVWPTTKVLTYSIGHYSNYASALPVGDEYCDANNCHVYNHPGVLAQLNTSNSTPTRQGDFASWKKLAPSKPVWITETGFVSGVASDPKVWIDERAAASLMLRNLVYFYANSGDTGIVTYPFSTAFGGWGDGVKKAFVYELLDQYAAATSTEHRFGLFTARGKPKPAATLLKNTIALLADPGESFTPTDLGITLSAGGNINVSYIAFQKRDGSYWVMFWSGATDAVSTPYGNSSMQPQTGSVSPDARKVITFGLGQTFNCVDVYRPMHGASPVASSSKTSSIAVTTTNDPQIIRLANTKAGANSKQLLQGFYESRPGL